MSRWYLDSSAALKAVMEEPESAALIRLIDEQKPNMVGCWLLDTEMRRAVHRNPVLSQDLVSEFLDRVDLHEVPASLFRQAGLFPGEHLRSLDAIHLAAAIQLDVDELVTYDVRMAESAKLLGLHVLAPA